MANNKIQIKRTSVSGRLPNTTNSANTQYIAAGELALNLTDSILYSSDGTNLLTLTPNVSPYALLSGGLFTGSVNATSYTTGTIGTGTGGVIANVTTIFVGNNTINTSITAGTLSVNGAVTANNSGAYPASNTVGTALGSTTQRWIINANTINASGLITGSSGATITGTTNTSTAFQISTTFIANTTGVYHTGTINAASYTVGSSFIANTSQLTISGIPLSANGSNGTSGQVLTSNGNSGAPYWSTVSGGGGGSVNTAAQYTFTNTITFSNTITIANVSANGSTGTSGQVLTSDGTKAYWQTITPVRQSYTGDGTTTSFSVSGGYTANQLDVYLNGVKATSSEATVSSGTDVVFAAAPPNNAIIAVVGINAVTLTISSSVQKSGDTMTGSLAVGNVAISLNDIQISGNVIANSSGAVVSATYVQNTDSRFLSGNLNFTAANVNFTQGLFVGTTTFANTTGMYTTNINATSINATSFTTTGTLANTSGVYPTSNTSGFNLGNTTSRWVITANSIVTSGNITSSASVVDVAGDVRSIPQNSKTAVYELLSSDNGKHISTNAAVTVNGAVLSTSQVFSVYNNSAASLTITQGTGATMYLAGSATTGNRTLAQRGICTILMVGSNTFVISGSGLT